MAVIGSEDVGSTMPVAGGLDVFRSVTRTAALWLIVLALAWSPFPLGGAISWASGLQELLVAACWALWALSSIGRAAEVFSSLRTVALPIILGAITLTWACIQMVPNLPPGWIHPVWTVAADSLQRPIDGVISLNPWRTETEVVKLFSYAMMCWIAFRLGRHTSSATFLLNAIVVIGAAYAVYAFGLAFAGVSQTAAFYPLPVNPEYVSGPFMLHNSFATYMGLVLLVGVARLLTQSGEAIVAERGARQLILTIIQFCFNRGVPLLLASLLCFAGVVASASRAGFVSALCGLVAMGLASLFIRRSDSVRLWTFVAIGAALLPIFVLVTLNGDTLGNRTLQLLDTGTADNIRLALWVAVSRMVGDAPWLGLGLGTFQDAYPLYATQVLPFVMDKAHCDYLEFAAGVGLPAAISWWLAILWLVGTCLRGVVVRRRNRLYPIIAVGASVLVGVHSAVDFSLQLPAVSLLYATLLGIGVAQAIPTRSSHR